MYCTHIQNGSAVVEFVKTTAPSSKVEIPNLLMQFPHFPSLFKKYSLPLHFPFFSEAATITLQYHFLVIYPSFITSKNLIGPYLSLGAGGTIVEPTRLDNLLVHVQFVSKKY